MGEYLIKSLSWDIKPASGLKTYTCDLLFDESDYPMLVGDDSSLEVMFIAMPEIKKVIFNDPATIVLWSDGTKTVVRCQDGDKYSKETGLAMAIAKKAYGNSGRYNDVMKKWCE